MTKKVKNWEYILALFGLLFSFVAIYFMPTFLLLHHQEQFKITEKVCHNETKSDYIWVENISFINKTFNFTLAPIEEYSMENILASQGASSWCKKERFAIPFYSEYPLFAIKTFSESTNLLAPCYLNTLYTDNQPYSKYCEYACDFGYMYIKQDKSMMNLEVKLDFASNIQMRANPNIRETNGLLKNLDVKRQDVIIDVQLEEHTSIYLPKETVEEVCEDKEVNNISLKFTGDSDNIGLFISSDLNSDKHPLISRDWLNLHAECTAKLCNELNGCVINDDTVAFRKFEWKCIEWKKGDYKIEVKK